MFPIAFNLAQPNRFGRFDKKLIMMIIEMIVHIISMKLLDDIKFVHPGYFAKENEFITFIIKSFKYC